MQEFLIFLSFLFIALAFPFAIAFLLGKRASKEAGDADLRARVRVIEIYLPFIIFLFGVFGVKTYDSAVEKVSKEVYKVVLKQVREPVVRIEEEIKAEQERIKVFVPRAKCAADSLDSLVQASTESANLLASKVTEFDGSLNVLTRDWERTIDSLSTGARSSFLSFLPKGTIIPYQGSLDKIDSDDWAICDGTGGTPDLRDRFLIGAGPKTLGPPTGGASEHSHEVHIAGRFQVADKILHTHNYYTVENAQRFEIYHHKDKTYSVKLDTTITTSPTSSLPPYYKVVFLMKVR